MKNIEKADKSKLWKTIDPSLTLVKQGSSNDSSGLDVTINTPRDATALAPTQTTPRFRDALVEALSSNSLHPSYKQAKLWPLEKEIKYSGAN